MQRTVLPVSAEQGRRELLSPGCVTSHNAVSRKPKTFWNALRLAQSELVCSSQNSTSFLESYWLGRVFRRPSALIPPSQRASDTPEPQLGKQDLNASVER